MKNWLVSALVMGALASPVAFAHGGEEHAVSEVTATETAKPAHKKHHGKKKHHAKKKGHKKHNAHKKTVEHETAVEHKIEQETEKTNR